MSNITARQRAEQIATDFIEAELEDDQDAKRWLIERITAAIEDGETAALDTFRGEPYGSR
jgi:hypothetical protein